MNHRFCGVCGKIGQEPDMIIREYKDPVTHTGFYHEECYLKWVDERKVTEERRKQAEEYLKKLEEKEK